MTTIDLLKKKYGDRGDLDDGLPVPLDGDIYTTSEYLKNISGSNMKFYTLYVRHLQYFCGMYKLEGDDDIERLSSHIVRQAIEFGKVGFTKIKDKYIPFAVVNLELDKSMIVKTVEGTTLRTGYGYNKTIETFKLSNENCSILLNNYQGFPFIVFWKSIISNILRLEQSALTASIASIKKFKRNLSNNDSDINKIETDSMMDPSHPYVNNVAAPFSYKQEMTRAHAGDTSVHDKINSSAPNSLEFNSIGENTQYVWDNLKEFINFSYWQHGRRINTNKKQERNLEGEINTEVINFEMLENEFKWYFENFVKDINKKFGLNVRLVNALENLNVEKGMIQEENKEQINPKETK